MVSCAVARFVRPAAVMVVVVVIVVSVGWRLVTLLLLGLLLLYILLLLLIIIFFLVEELSALLDVSRVLALSALGSLRVQRLLARESPRSTGAAVVVVMVVVVVVILSPGGRRSVVDVLGSPGRLCPLRPLLFVYLPILFYVGVSLVLALMVVVMVVVMMVVLVVLSGALPLH